MNINELIDSLWEKSSHGTDRETVVMIFTAALEEAAKVCDKKSNAHDIQGKTFILKDLVDCASAIRALKVEDEE